MDNFNVRSPEKNDTVFLNLVRGNRLSNYLGLVSLDETSAKKPYKFSKDYGCIEFPLYKAISGETGKNVRKVKAGTRVTLLPACEISPDIYRVLIEPHGILHKAATLSHKRIWEPGDKGQPEIFADFHDDFDLSDVPYLLKLYMIK